ncbi:molecular chaperone HtpG [Bradyrhizobium sp. WD16]|uniref:molecular chaperone HtpG n=1 Tax=Bradyrhizobium sp. WD16 TaxID=1521768 RepID=UPI0020A3E441|nr:molecular chaperone HtpG [Bradyrhizobium sp. WD16]UTD30362.1 molecular chaperone HtpG [Bradyrhizobium sp. WD16]
MTTATAPESRAFEADVAKLLRLLVHSVYSDRDVFLRELISNAADACEKLRYEAIADPSLLGDDPQPRITVRIDAEAGRLTIEDNGFGMDHDDLVASLGTIANSGTKAFMERIEAAKGEGPEAASAQLIGQFGVGFYSAFMVADLVDVVSRRAGTDQAWLWSSDGQGGYTVAPAEGDDAPLRGTRVILHLIEDAKTYLDRLTLERIIKTRSGHVPVPIAIVEKPGAEAAEVGSGAALWTRSRSEITAQEYTDFYHSFAGQFDEPALTIHARAEGRHEYTMLLFVPGMKPFDLFDPDRKGRIKLYVKRVFVTDDAEIAPRYLRFVRGLVDSADLPLNVSREMIQGSPILTAIKKGVSSRILSELEKLAKSDVAAYDKIWSTFGAVIKEGLYEDFERRPQLLDLARFTTTTSGDGWRTLKDYVGSLKPNQTAIYYIAGDDAARLAASPHLEGFRARGIEVLLLSDQVDSFWVSAGLDYEGKPFKSVTQGAAELDLIPLPEAAPPQDAETSERIAGFVAFVKETLGEAISDARASERLTSSAVCLVAPDSGMDRQLEKILAGAGRIGAGAKPVLEINPRHDLVVALAAGGTDDKEAREDAVRLLFDEAKILDGEPIADAQAFAERLGRVIRRGLG